MILEQTGFTNVIEIDDLEAIRIDGRLDYRPAVPGRALRPQRAHQSGLCGPVGRAQLLFAADSCNIEPRLYADICTSLSATWTCCSWAWSATARRCSWLYGPLLTRPLSRKHGSFAAAGRLQLRARSVDCGRSQCSEVYVYAMGQEPWLNHVMSMKYTGSRIR